MSIQKQKLDVTYLMTGLLPFLGYTFLVIGSTVLVLVKYPIWYRSSCAYTDALYLMIAIGFICFSVMLWYLGVQDAKKTENEANNNNE